MSWIVHPKGASQLLLPIGLRTGGIAVQGQGLLPFLHHLMAHLPLAGASHCHLHQGLCLPAANTTTVTITVTSVGGDGDKSQPDDISDVDACFCWSQCNNKSSGVQSTCCAPSAC